MIKFKLQLSVLSMLLAIAFVNTGCQEEIVLSPTEVVSSEIVNEVENENGVTHLDVEKVIQTLKPTRSRSDMYTIESINDSNGTPLLYCVNFKDNQGFMLLSGCKTFSPILAYSDEGRFDLNTHHNPTCIWMELISEAIIKSETLPKDSVECARLHWQKLLFESSNSKDAVYPINSRGEADVTFEEYQKLQNMVYEARQEWESKGYRTYSITELVTDEEWCQHAQQRAQEAIYPLYDHLWEQLSFYVEHEETEYNRVVTTVTTKWSQGYPYNIAFPFVNEGRAVVGCGPLAVGQLMNYYRYPSSFNWDAIDKDIMKRSEMLYDVAEACKATYKENATSVKVSNVVSALKQYGFKAELLNQNDARSSYPMICRGEIDGEGHEWLATGHREYLSHHYFDCWTLTERYHITDFERSQDVGLSSQMIYYNWGWGGLYDGWYYDDGLILPNHDGKITDRQKVVVSLP